MANFELTIDDQSVSEDAARRRLIRRQEITFANEYGEVKIFVYQDKSLNISYFGGELVNFPNKMDFIELCGQIRLTLLDSLEALDAPKYKFINTVDDVYVFERLNGKQAGMQHMINRTYFWNGRDLDESI